MVQRNAPTKKVAEQTQILRMLLLLWLKVSST
jgi:hypothetical protein